MKHAYLLVQIDPEAMHVVAAGVFSEASPTGLLALRWAIVDEFKAESFDVAQRALWRLIDHPCSQHAWLRPLLARPRTGTETFNAITPTNKKEST